MLRNAQKINIALVTRSKELTIVQGTPQMKMIKCKLVPLI